MEPDDDYLASLGRFVYAVALMEWTVLGLLPSIPGLPERLRLEALAGETTGGIGRRLADVDLLAEVADPKVRDWLSLFGAHFQVVAERRNAVLHARPAAIDGKPRLYRWLPSGEILSITDNVLAERLKDVKRA